MVNLVRIDDIRGILYQKPLKNIFYKTTDKLRSFISKICNFKLDLTFSALILALKKIK